jgi:hypothetical protein
VTGTKEQLVKDAISGTVKLVPHVASKSDDNLVPEKAKEALDKQKTGEKSKDDDVVHNLVQGMISRTI